MTIKQTWLSKGQIALDNARKKGFNVKELPKPLKDEIIEFHEAGISVKDIAEHFNLMEFAVNHCLVIKQNSGLQSTNKIKPSPKQVQQRSSIKPEVKVDEEYHSLNVSRKSYDYVSSLATILGTTRRDIVDRITTYLQKENNKEFLKKSIKDE